MKATLAMGRVEVAADLGVSPSTVDRLEHAGIIPPRRRLGGRAIWLRSELEAKILELPQGTVPERTAAARQGRKAKRTKAAK